VSSVSLIDIVVTSQNGVPKPVPRPRDAWDLE
jgi:hypothetical protein